MKRVTSGEWLVAKKKTGKGKMGNGGLEGWRRGMGVRRGAAKSNQASRGSAGGGSFRLLI